MGQIFKKWRTTDGFSRSGKITAWSFSRYNDYIKCPLLAKFKHVMDMKEPENDAMQKGTLIHMLAEQFVRGDLEELPAQFEKVKKLMKELRKRESATEDSWNLTRDWQLCDWNDWNNVWLRMKIDTHYLTVEKKGTLRKTTVHVIDYKTGREYGDHALQKELYAIGAFIKYPEAVEVIATHVYIDSGVLRPTSFKPKQLEELKERWVLRTKALTTDTRFKPKPGGHCQYCFFSKNKNGPCEF